MLGFGCLTMTVLVSWKLEGGGSMDVLVRVPSCGVSSLEGSPVTALTVASPESSLVVGSPVSATMVPSPELLG